MTVMVLFVGSSMGFLFAFLGWGGGNGHQCVPYVFGVIFAMTVGHALQSGCHVQWNGDGNGHLNGWGGDGCGRHTLHVICKCIGV